METEISKINPVLPATNVTAPDDTAIAAPEEALPPPSKAKRSYRGPVNGKTATDRLLAAASEIQKETLGYVMIRDAAEKAQVDLPTASAIFGTLVKSGQVRRAVRGAITVLEFDPTQERRRGRKPQSDTVAIGETRLTIADIQILRKMISASPPEGVRSKEWDEIFSDIEGYVSSRLGTTLHRLVDRGFVERLGTRRSYAYRISDDGRKAVADFEQRVNP